MKYYQHQSCIFCVDFGTFYYAVHGGLCITVLKKYLFAASNMESLLYSFSISTLAVDMVLMLLI